MGSNDEMGGGLIVHYITLVQYLRKNSHIHLMCINVNDQRRKIFSDNVITEISVPYKSTSFFQKVIKYLTLLKAIRIAKKFNPDVFVACSLGYGYAKVAARLSATTFKIFQEVHYEAIADKLRLKMIEHFDAVATQTEGMINIFKKNVSEKKPVAALPCFSKEYLSEEFFSIPSVDVEIRLAYFGRLAWNKGLRQFLIAVGETFRSNPNLKLSIYGRGPELISLQNEINQQKIESQVQLKGFYEDDQFPSFISSCHGIIIPSIDTEGLPLVLIEAMRFGRPIFATDTGAMSEIKLLNKNGIIISPKEASISWSTILIVL